MHLLQPRPPSDGPWMGGRPLSTAAIEQSPPDFDPRHRGFQTRPLEGTGPIQPPQPPDAGPAVQKWVPHPAQPRRPAGTARGPRTPHHKASARGQAVPAADLARPPMLGSTLLLPGSRTRPSSLSADGGHHSATQGRTGTGVMAWHLVGHPSRWVTRTSQEAPWEVWGPWGAMLLDTPPLAPTPGGFPSELDWASPRLMASLAIAHQGQSGQQEPTSPDCHLLSTPYPTALWPYQPWSPVPAHHRPFAHAAPAASPGPACLRPALRCFLDHLTQCPGHSPCLRATLAGCQGRQGLLPNSQPACRYPSHGQPRRDSQEVCANQSGHSEGARPLLTSKSCRPLLELGPGYLVHLEVPVFLTRSV